MDFSLPFTSAEANLVIYALFAVIAIFGFLGGFIKGIGKSVLRLIAAGGIGVGAYLLADIVARQVFEAPLPGISLTVGTDTYNTLGSYLAALIESVPVIQEVLGSDTALLSELVIDLPLAISRLMVFLSLAAIGFTIVLPIVSLILNAIFKPFAKPAKMRLVGGLVNAITGVAITATTLSPVVVLRPVLYELQDGTTTYLEFIPSDVTEGIVTVGTPFDELALTPFSYFIADSLASFDFDGEHVVVREELEHLVRLAKTPNLPSLDSLATLDITALTQPEIDAIAIFFGGLGESKIIAPFFPALVTYLFETANLGDYISGLDLSGDIDWAAEISAIANALATFASLGVGDGFDLTTLTAEDLSDLLTSVGDSEILQEVVSTALNDQTAAFFGDDVEITFWDEVDYETVAPVAAELLTIVQEGSTPTQEDLIELATVLAEDTEFLEAVNEDLNANDIGIEVTQTDLDAIESDLVDQGFTPEQIDNILDIFDVVG